MNATKHVELVACAFLMLNSITLCEDPILMHMSFDDSQDATFRYGQGRRRFETKEAVTGVSFPVFGLAEYAPGVAGTGMRFDGFSYGSSCTQINLGGYWAGS